MNNTVMPMELLRAVAAVLKDSVPGCEIEAAFLAKTGFEDFGGYRHLNDDNEVAESSRVPIHTNGSIASGLRDPPEMERFEFKVIFKNEL
jgi:hypothetical protein